MGAEESTLNCCARSRHVGSSASSRYDHLEDDTKLTAEPELPDKVAVSEVIKEGYLIKLNQRGIHKPRFFRIKSDLYYFGTKDEYIPKGMVSLAANGRLPIVNDCPNLAPYALEIRHATGCFFRSEDNSDMSDWKSAIQKAIKSASETPRKILDSLAEENGPPMLQANNLDYSARSLIKEGYLLRRSFGSEWKRYWVVVREGVLQYFSSNQALTPKGTMDLTMTISITIDCPNAYVPNLNASMLHVSAMKSMFLIAESRDDQLQWITAINTAIDLQENENATMRKNPLGWKRTGRIKEVITSFTDLLRDPFRVEYFRAFMRETGCTQYLLFWLDVQQFKRLCKKEDRFYLKPCASVIYTKYIKEGGSNYVGLSSMIADKTLPLIEEPNVNTFRDPQFEIFRILRDDFYPIFLTSSHCHAMAAALFATVN